MSLDINKLVTEGRNPDTMNFSDMSVSEAVRAMNKEDKIVALAVEKALAKITTAIEWSVRSLKRGGRIIYIGAGTAGRMGMLDAVECPPTFGVEGLVVPLLAGGENAFVRAVEGAEDKGELGERDLKGIAVNSNDTVIGISASGRTPYVVGGIVYARSIGCPTVGISCNPCAKLSTAAELGIEIITGPECLTGSTRLKAGSAQKMVLNMISTVAMAQIGRVRENLMVYVRPTNEKLKLRAKSIEKAEGKL